MIPVLGVLSSIAGGMGRCSSFVGLNARSPVALLAAMVNIGCNLLFQDRACAMFILLFPTSCFMPIMFEHSSDKCLQDCKHSQAALQAKCLFTPWGNQYRTRQIRSSKSCETQDSFVPRGEAKALSSRVRLRISTLANCLSTGQLQLKEVKIRPRRPPSAIIRYLTSSPDRCLKETVVTTVMLEVAKLATDSNPHRPED